MGWSRGSSVFSDIIKAVKANVPDVETRKKIYRPIIDSMQDLDWDTEDECLGEDEAYDAIYAELFGEDDD